MFSELQAAFPSQNIRFWTQEPGTEARWEKARTRHWTDHHIEHVIGATGVTRWWVSGRQRAGLVRCLATDIAPQKETMAVIQVGSWCQQGPYVDRPTAVGTAWWGKARPWVLATYAAFNPEERESWDKNRAQWFRHLPSENWGKLDVIIWAALVTGHAGILMMGEHSKNELKIGTDQAKEINLVLGMAPGREASCPNHRLGSGMS